MMEGVDTNNGNNNDEDMADGDAGNGDGFPDNRLARLRFLHEMRLEAEGEAPPPNEWNDAFNGNNDDDDDAAGFDNDIDNDLDHDLDMGMEGPPEGFERRRIRWLHREARREGLRERQRQRRAARTQQQQRLRGVVANGDQEEQDDPDDENDNINNNHNHNNNNNIGDDVPRRRLAADNPEEFLRRLEQQQQQDDDDENDDNDDEGREARALLAGGLGRAQPQPGAEWWVDPVNADANVEAALLGRAVRVRVDNNNENIPNINNNHNNNHNNNNNDENDNNNDNDNINDENDDDNDNDDFDGFLRMDFAQGRFEHTISALRAAREYISPALFDMVQEGRTCSSVLSGWGRSEQHSCYSIVQHCEAHPDGTLYVSRLGRMPLHEACLRGACRHVVKALLEATNNRGAKERDQQGNTPLHLLFVDYSSSDLNNANLVWSPEDLAQVVGDLLAVNPLTIASCTNADGDTPLHSACMAPETMVDPSSIVQLLQASPRAATKMNRKNQTPLRLHCQRRNASPEVASLLLEETIHSSSHALIGLDNERGWAPIHAAAANANFTLLRYLVESFPESVKVQTTQRQTALHLLCQHHTHLSSSRNNNTTNNNNSSNSYNNQSNSNNNSSSIPNVEAAVEFLLKADPEAIMHQDSTNGYTPLHLVCKTEGSRQVPLPVVKLLLGCNPRSAGIPDFRQYLPLHHACEMGCTDLELTRALVEAYPESTKALTRKGDSALSLACTSNKSAATVQLLIHANRDVLTQTNDYGFCPLHCVCRTHQPRMGIVKALVEACPESVLLQTHSGETPFHLASSNTGAFVGVLQVLAQTQTRLRNDNNSNCGGSADEAMSLSASASATSMLEETTWTIESDTDAYLEGRERHTEIPHRNPLLLDILDPASSTQHDRGDGSTNTTNDNNNAIQRSPSFIRRTVTTNKMGNTPLHDACFRSTPYEHLEVIAKANPEYILVRNNAGYTPLQILCKNGRIDERIISTFAQMGGPEIFSVRDSNGNTPLHSAMRKDVDVASLRCLIRASPDALRCRTTYGDLPLHLACLRKCTSEVVQEVAIAASSGDVSLAVVPNLAGQTPIGIAMGEFKNLCREGATCTVSAAYRPTQRRIFQVLSTLVKIVHYGPVRCQQQGTKDLSLLKACVVLHRQNIRLDPAFIRQVIHVYPEEVKLVDEDGNYPLHIEASIPIEKMSLLDGICTGTSHRRMGILRILLEAYPTACSFRNKENHFPLGLMIQAGRVWGHTIAVALRAFPPALHWYKGLDDRFSSILLEKASKECGADTLFALLVSRPGLFDATSHTLQQEQQQQQKRNQIHALHRL